MNEGIQKTIVAITLMGVVGGLQVYAWATGHNGTVFATTSAILGLIGGYFFGSTKKN